MIDQVTVDLRAFERDMALYARLSKKTLQEVVLKKAASIAFEWASRLKTIAPAKGEITRQALAKFKTGVGIYIRRRAYELAANKLGKRRGTYTDLVSRRIMRKTRKGIRGATDSKGLNRQALAAKYELGMRERARGFSAVGARMRSKLNSLGNFAAHLAATPGGGVWRSEYTGAFNQKLSEANVKISTGGDNVSMFLLWGSVQSEIGESLTKRRQEAMLHDAIQEVHRDMMVYVDRKMNGRAAS